MATLSIGLRNPPESSIVYRNQVFEIKFPGNITSANLTKEQGFISVDSTLDYVWCTAVVDDTDNTILKLYPNTLIPANLAITLNISEILYIDSDNITHNSGTLYWLFTSSSLINDYESDPLSPIYTPITPDPEDNTPLEILASSPGYGESNIPGNTVIAFEFNKPVDLTDIERYISIRTEHVFD